MVRLLRDQNASLFCKRMERLPIGLFKRQDKSDIGNGNHLFEAHYPGSADAADPGRTVASTLFRPLCLAR
jgi:hypothetical protein